MTYDNPWIHQENIFTSEDIQDNVGFVYCITNLTNNKKYLGRKYFFSYRKPKGKKRKVKQEKESINLPISTMVNIANKTIKNYVQQLDENTKGKLLRFLSSDISEMESKYKVVKESVLNKLTNIKENSEKEVVDKINETILKITNEKFDKLNLFRLEELDSSI